MWIVQVKIGQLWLDKGLYKTQEEALEAIKSFDTSMYRIVFEEGRKCPKDIQ